MDHILLLIGPIGTARAQIKGPLVARVPGQDFRCALGLAPRLPVRHARASPKALWMPIAPDGRGARCHL